MYYTGNGRNISFFSMYMYAHMHSPYCNKKFWHVNIYRFFFFPLYTDLDRADLFCSKLSVRFELVDMQQELNLSCLLSFVQNWFLNTNS